MLPGTVLKRKSDKILFRVIGVYDDKYVVTPHETHGESAALSVAEVRKNFGAPVEAPTEGDAQSGWRRLSEHLRGLSNRRDRRTLRATPEEIFAQGAHEHAVALAQRIAASDDLMADYAVGLLDVSDDVAAELDKIADADAGS